MPPPEKDAMADLQTLARLQAYRTTLETAIQEAALGASEFTIEGFEYDGDQAYNNLRKELTSVEMRIAVLEGGATKEPQRLGVDVGDLSDDV